MRRWPKLYQRLLDLAQTLRGHGIVWTPFGEMGVEVRRGSRIPPAVVAEMKSLLEDLRALVRAGTAASEVADFARRCRELAREFPEKSADFDALAERSRRERTAHWEERELLLAAAMGEPAWGGIRFLEGGEKPPFELPELSGLVGDDYRVEPEPTPLGGFMDLWRLVLAWESGVLEGEPS
jgi:hypothetical protein